VVAIMAENLYKQKKKYSEAALRESLTKQLESKGADIAHFTEMVEQYINLYKMASALYKDIKTRGVVYEDFSSVGVKMIKNNTSVKEVVGVNRQMLAILKDLGLTTDNVPGEDTEENL
jgi:hypothetical protein